MPPSRKTIVEPSGTDATNSLSASDTSVAPVASIVAGTSKAAVVCGGGNGRATAAGATLSDGTAMSAPGPS